MLTVFGVVYAGFDTYAGLATGTVVRCAQDLSAAEQACRRTRRERAFVAA